MNTFKNDLIYVKIPTADIDLHITNIVKVSMLVDINELATIDLGNTTIVIFLATFHKSFELFEWLTREEAQAEIAQDQITNRPVI